MIASFFVVVFHDDTMGRERERGREREEGERERERERERLRKWGGTA